MNKLLIPAKDGLRGIPLSKADRAAESPARLSGKRPVGSCPQIPAACLSCWTGQPTHIKLRKNEELRSVIEIMIEKFMQEDVRTLKFQTHATLSATRGILRFYGATHEQKYLDYAVQRMEEYVSSGMTETYMNYNWYQRPNGQNRARSLIPISPPWSCSAIHRM